MRQFIQDLPVARVFATVTSIVTILLVAVCILAVRKYLIFNHCKLVTAQSSQLVFQFSSIKEHINETLITGGKINVSDLTIELQGIGVQIDHILQDVLIPEELKISSMYQTDLAGIIVGLRGIGKAATSVSQEERLSVLKKINALQSYLQKFNKVLNNYAHSLSLKIQKTLIGFLAVTIFIISTLFFLMNRFITDPILQFCKQVSIIQPAQNENEKLKFSYLETSLHQLLRFMDHTVEENKRLTQLYDSIEQILSLCEIIHSKTEIWEITCSVLIKSQNYCLAWIGYPGKDNFIPVPVKATGCQQLTPQECFAALSHLLKYRKSNAVISKTARLAAQTGDIELARTTLSSLPEKSLNLFPSTEGLLTCISFPIVYEENSLSILTLYHVGQERISKQEIVTLSFFCNQLSSLLTQPANQQTAGMFTNIRLHQLCKLSFIGSLTTHLTHQLLNQLNGVINYTQALIDTDECSLHHETSVLLQNLFAEEKKIGKLTTSLLEFIQETERYTGKYRVETMLNQVTSLLKGFYKAQTNTIEIKLIIDSGLPEIKQHGIDIQLALLMILQNIFTRFDQEIISKGHLKTVVITCKNSVEDDTKLTITIQDWEKPYDHERVCEKKVMPWQDQRFLDDYLASFGAEIQTRIHPDDDSTIYQLTLPQACLTNLNP